MTGTRHNGWRYYKRNPLPSTTNIIAGSIAVTAVVTSVNRSITGLFPGCDPLSMWVVPMGCDCYKGRSGRWSWGSLLVLGRGRRSAREMVVRVPQGHACWVVAVVALR